MPAPEERAPLPGAALARARRAPLWQHAAALALVLLAVLGIVERRWSYSADEGAAILEARSLSAGDGWIVEHPLPAADPQDQRYPLELSEWGERGVAPYAKHPLYPVVLAAADRVGGITGMLLLSLVGTVGAAVAGALLARRVRPGTELATFWALGLLSPLLFDGFWVIAHSLAAAFVGFAAVAALRAEERRRPAWGLVAGGCLALALALRTEVVFVCAGFAVVAGVATLVRRSLPAAVTAGATVVAVAGVRVVESRVLHAVVGDPRARPTFGSSGSGSFLGDRWGGFVQTWLSPDAAGGSTAALLLVLATAGAAVAVWQLRRRTPDPVLLRAGAVAAAALSLLRVVLLPATAVPGLLVAFPLLWVGLVAGGREAVADRTARALGAVAAIGALGVLATQYRAGGSAEWGGRYFAVLLPLAVPLAVAGLAAAAARLDAPTVRLLGSSLLVGALASSALAVLTLRASHEVVARGIEAIDAAAASLPEPVIVSTEPGVPRFAWSTFDRQRWLLVDPERDGSLAQDLAAIGIDRFVLVSDDLAAAQEALGGLVRVPGTPEYVGLAVVELP